MKFKEITADSKEFQDSMKIYRDSFPEWEREDEKDILKNIQSKIYKMIISLYKNKVVGFYILDINENLNYMILSFLAIEKSYRGRGIGSELCQKVINDFYSISKQDWLLIEAEERQSKLYSKLGFKDIKLDYKVPSFESQESIDMHLMLLQKEVPLTQNMLMKIIKDIFYRGYALKKDDVRITQQLKRVEESKSLFCYTHTHETIH